MNGDFESECKRQQQQPDQNHRYQDGDQQCDKFFHEIPPYEMEIGGHTNFGQARNQNIKCDDN